MVQSLFVLFIMSLIVFTLINLVGDPVDMLVNPESLPEEIERVRKDKIDEVILATSATVEGQTTAFYIQDSLKDIDVKITKLAQGLPVGGEIENLDDGTLLSAFKNRSKINSNSS